jgi:hypothetical protein
MIRRGLVGGALTAALAVGAIGAGQAAASERGALLSSEPMELSATLQATGAQGRRITYESRALGGDEIVVSGAVLVPPGQPPAGGWPVVSWGHGTTGSADACAPSRFPDFRGTDGLLAQFIDAGYAVAATDYEGLGTPGPHAYLIGKSEARGIIDAVRAARQLNPAISATWFASGHSQGSQAAATAGEIADTYGGGLDYRGTVGFAAPINLAPSLDQRLANIRGDFGSQALYLLILAGLKTQHAELSYADYLGPRAIKQLDLVETACLSDIVQSFASLDLPAEEFQPVDEHARDRLKAWLAREGVPGEQAAGPLALLVGENDEIVGPAEAASTVAAACALGTTTSMQLFPGVNHDGILAVGGPSATAWFDDRLAGVPAPSSC